ncbi:MAG TPA: long-chain fatty acid--CoA ligase [Streptosporangiaceae bacterium]|nr:long-chain fatty acid--CoA ligase [Streptosporangiaceae bacterium]
MRATMMDTPLTITTLMRYGTTAYGDHEVITATMKGAREAGTGMRRRPYREIGLRAARLAGALRGLGVTGDQRVATLMWNNAEHLEAYLAVPSMGAVLHTLNLRLAPAVIGYIAEHAEDQVVIVDATLLPLLATVLPHAPSIRHIVISNPESETNLPGESELGGNGRQVHSYEDLLAGQPDSFDWPELDERSAAAMCYTSGTTGRPKGVVYSHRSMHLHSMAIAMGNVFGLSDQDKVLPVVPMFHANAWGLPYAAVMAGAGMLMPDRFLQPAPLAAMIEAERPTLAGAVPTIWNGLLQHVRANGGDLSSLRLVPCGGSAVPHSLIEAYQKELGVTIVQAWGMTETSPLGSVARPPAGLPDDESWHYRDTQGRLICQVEGRLVGDEGTVLPNDGVAVGEVEVRGPWVTGSYYKDDDPGKFHDGWLRTGDVGNIDPLGYVTLTDRAKDVIKSGGEWISSMELENALMAHPSVSEAAVIGVPDYKWGERPLAAVVVAEDAKVSADELRAFLAERVPRWQLPERWSFIAEVPKTSVGKFAKTTMREAYANGDYLIIEVR